MDKKFMLFSERLKLAEEYEKFVNTPLEDGSKIKDCALSVITFMQTKGFRKIPEGAVVLTGEEWRNLNKNYEILKLELKEVRKETAEKFAERLKDEVLNFCGTVEENGYFERGKMFFCDDIDEICKEITGGK